MRALVASGQQELVCFQDVAEPELAEGEALVAVEAFSVNRGETFLLERPRPGWRPGKDVAGRVLVAAPNGSGPQVGQRVVGHPPSAGWAERVAVPIESLTVLPDSVDAQTAAALPLAGLTAVRLLRAVGDLVGRRLLITGASGGVGHYFVELAAAAGAEITAVSASVERGARLRELGAGTVVTDVGEAAGQFDVVLDSVGGNSLPVALSKLRPRGTAIWFGQASREPVTLNFFDFFAGPNSGTLCHFDYTDSVIPYGTDLATLVRLVVAGRLHPEIGRIADWEHVATSLRDLRERRIRGKSVLLVSS